MKDIGLNPEKIYNLRYLRNQALGWLAEKRGIE